LSIEEARLLLAIEGPHSPVFTKSSTKDMIVYDFGYRAVKFEYYWISVAFMVSDGQFLFNFIYFVLSMQGLIQSPVFYSIHLLDTINRFPELQAITRSVTENLD